MQQKITVNVLSDYIKHKNFFGVNGAMIAAQKQSKALEKYANVVINADECDIVNSHGCYSYTFKLMKKLKREGKPVVISAHQTHYDTKNAVRGSRLLVPIVKRYLKKYYSKGDLLIVPTMNSKRIIETELCDNEIRIISNGVNTKEFKFSEIKRQRFRKKWSLKEDFTVISVGMPIKRKGFPTYINLAKKQKQNKFLWVGKPGFPLLQKKQEVEVKNFIMTGYVKDLNSAYSSADVFCFPSIYEGQGIVILEAAACGLPIIVRDIPTYEGWLIDGKNCLKAKSEEEFLEKIQYLKDNPQDCKKLSKASLKLAKEHDIDLTARKLMKCFKELLN